MRTRILALGLAAVAGSLPAQTAEVRGVWITNTDTEFFDSWANVAAGMQALADAHVNVVFPVVWSKGYTLYPSATLERVIGEAIDPRYAGRDPLAEVVFEAHRRGIEVIPWFEYGFTAGHRTTGAPVLDARPGWAAIGRDDQPVVKNGFHWMNPMAPEVQGFVAQLVLEVCAAYDVDGVQGDDRLPAMPAEAGYDHATRTAWFEHSKRAPPDDVHDERWTRWRADRLTEFLADLRNAVKAVSADLMFSMAPGAPGWAYRDYLQDQATWVRRKLLDALHPQAYARELPRYRAMLDEILAIDWIARQGELLSPGVLARIGDWQASDELLVGCVAENRRRALAGSVFFFHQGLLDRDGALLAALAGGPYAEAARLPWRDRAGWRPLAVVAERRPEPGPHGESVWVANVPEPGTYQLHARLPDTAPPGAGFAFRLPGDAKAWRVEAGDARGWRQLPGVELRRSGSQEAARFLAPRTDGDHPVLDVTELVLLIERR